MNMLLAIVHGAAPLLVVTLGALISEYVGRMAMFLECTINLGAFFCYLFTTLCHSLAAGMCLSVLCCAAIVLLCERVASRFKANMFFISLAMNMLFSAMASFFSAIIFGTRGVLYGPDFTFSAGTTRIATSLLCYALGLLQIVLLRRTTVGLALRITGTDGAVLQAHGRNPARYRTLAWLLAAADASLCGCVLAARLSSYVPGMASGRGWTALAAVFLGRKNPLFVCLAVILFALAEYASANIQNKAAFQNVPSSVLLALPYLIAIVLIVVVPQKREQEE